MEENGMQFVHSTLGILNSLNNRRSGPNLLLYIDIMLLITIVSRLDTPQPTLVGGSSVVHVCHGWFSHKSCMNHECVLAGFGSFE